MLLGDARRALVDQQVAHCHVGVAQIGAEKRLAKEINKLIPGGMAAEKLAALMPRAVEGAVALLDVIDQRAEERRAQLRFVLLRGGLQLKPVKMIAGIRRFKYAVDPRQAVRRNNFLFVGGDKYRNSKSRCV
jgi:hypothetical protein